MKRCDTQFETVKKRFFFIKAIVANFAPLGLCFFYRLGAPLLWTVFPVIYTLLFFVNTKCANRWLQVITLGLLHIVVTACTHLQFTWLYFHNICDDSLGRMLAAYLTIIGTGIAIILTIVSAIKFYRKQKVNSGNCK